MKIETYQELKKRQADEFNKFEGIFFAFSNPQLVEGMLKIGLTAQDTALIYSIGAGGFLKKSVAPQFHAMMDRHTAERKKLRKDTKLLIDALDYELSNHEYCITGDPTNALDALDLTIETVPAEVLKKAIAQNNARGIK